MRKAKKYNNEVYAAYHESGHAVAGWWLFGLKRIKKITIVPDPKNHSLGHFKPNRIMPAIDYEVKSSPAFEGKVMRQIMESFAGHIAERRIRKRANNIGAYKDFESVIDLISRLYGGSDEKLSKHLQDYLYRRTELLVEQRWNLIKALAKELLKRKEINRDEFWEILDKETKKEMNKFHKKRTN